VRLQLYFYFTCSDLSLSKLEFVFSHSLHLQLEFRWFNIGLYEIKANKTAVCDITL